MEPSEVLQQVAEEVSVCTKCPLYHSRKKAVPGEGPANAEILFVGEGPGYYENEAGRPFVGAAGKFLDELLGSIHLKRTDVFITNVVKCRPPGNRDPEPEEITTCTTNYLDRQMAAIHPKMIVTLGRHSMGLFLPDAKITKVHGKPAWVNGRMIVPMFHPAAALHQPALRNSVLADFAQLPKWIDEMEKKTGGAQEPESGGSSSENKNQPTQLTFF